MADNVLIICCFKAKDISLSDEFHRARVGDTAGMQRFYEVMEVLGKDYGVELESYEDDCVMFSGEDEKLKTMQKELQGQYVTHMMPRSWFENIRALYYTAGSANAPKM